MKLDLIIGYVGYAGIALASLAGLRYLFDANVRVTTPAGPFFAAMVVFVAMSSFAIYSSGSGLDNQVNFGKTSRSQFEKAKSKSEMSWRGLPVADIRGAFSDDNRLLAVYLKFENVDSKRLIKALYRDCGNEVVQQSPYGTAFGGIQFTDGELVCHSYGRNEAMIAVYGFGLTWFPEDDLRRFD